LRDERPYEILWSNTAESHHTNIVIPLRHRVVKVSAGLFHHVMLVRFSAKAKKFFHLYGTKNSALKFLSLARLTNVLHAASAWDKYQHSSLM
jgi:hypothetical protein